MMMWTFEIIHGLFVLWHAQRAATLTGFKKSGNLNQPFNKTHPHIFCVTVDV